MAFPSVPARPPSAFWICECRRCAPLGQPQLFHQSQHALRRDDFVLAAGGDGDRHREPLTGDMAIFAETLKFIEDRRAAGYDDTEAIEARATKKESKTQ